MKSILCAFVLLSASAALANPIPEGALVCDLDQPQSVLTAKANANETVNVYGHERITGHRWVSEEGLQATVLVPAKMGSVDTVVFSIDLRHQQEDSKTYSFMYKRPWESKPAAECMVTIEKAK